ncbi:peptidase domain-containing ABC transporter [Mucilaginibacter sp. KACC 22063]|uniref:peptidase domain-containing ABC transporter n=1 Tax=Mucilaginibacter sp. KACC 22063 TaxID=3025666 RepID=UPI002365616F|nr:peptidase domain-containing ABC transporter [Mucilaginibacter sp. KACC 22063]WDF56031.1 peptidase domain-containing ABC transporter [Mucilaginibacter sp. KACC 22063]
MASFPYYRQLESMDCGPTCLKMISKYYGKRFSLDTLRQKTKHSRNGVSLLGISQAAEQIGFRTVGARVNYEDLKESIHLPCIAHWDQNHFIVVYKIKKDRVFVADPGKSLLSYPKKEFLQKWAFNAAEKKQDGIVLLIEPTPNFYTEEEEQDTSIKATKILRYLRGYKKLFIQLLIGLLAAALLQTIFPFLTQSIVDIGINNNNINFINMILLGQLMLSLGQTTIELIRGWILLHISTRISISILSDFLTKLLRLPLSFFDTKITGDIMQRISDQKRVETFLTSTFLNTVFSFITLIVFGSVLVSYSQSIFLIFLGGSLTYFTWVYLFLKFRKKLDYKRFEISAANQNNIIQLMSGIHEIKMNDCGTQKLWEWERIQAQLFKFNTKSLSLSQYQQVGAVFINQTKNILIVFLAAKLVISGNLTLGSMLAIQFIVGQLNSPVEQFIQFLQSAQDAKISVDRLNDVHEVSDEEPDDRQFIKRLPPDKSIRLSNITFTYPGAGNHPVLKGIDLYIPEGKITAIVGDSGSGKTTILKLLLKIYNPDSGTLQMGETDYSTISHAALRKECGVVMQDGFIFSDTIANNIMVSNEIFNSANLLHAIKTANIDQFIKQSPLGLNTKIGAEGNGLSQGQKQRILIARAIYKDPHYMFFDEATNALDANNETKIMHNLNQAFKGRTVVVVAHRLSTVKNADQIIVLKSGQIVEQGKHEDLVNTRGFYYELIKNQLELGN